MTLSSVLRYRNYLLREANGNLSEARKISFRMKRPIHGVVLLREQTSDFLTFEEVILEEVYSPIATHLRNCQTIIDLGSNIGLTSLYFAARYPSCRILAVEPNPDSYAMLRANLAALIAAGRCNTLQVAAWRAEEALAIYQEPGRYSVSTVGRLTPGEKVGAGVKGMTLAEIIEHSGFDKVDLLKVDIEGSEIELFSGDRNWLQRIRAIAIEFHGNSRAICDFDTVMSDSHFAIHEENPHTVLAVRR